MPKAIMDEEFDDMAMITPARNSALKRMWETKEWADLTIETATRVFQVHKSVVCPACPFFHAACTNGFKETQTGVIQLEESEMVVEAILCFIYEQPIEGLRYVPLMLQDPVTCLRDETTAHHASMVLSIGDPSPSRMPAEEIHRTISRLLELDSAVDKYGLRALGCIVEASFCEYYVEMKNIVDMVELGDIVYAPNRHVNKVLRRYVRRALGHRFDGITNSPDAWSILYSNEELLKATLKEARKSAEWDKRRTVANKVDHERKKGVQKLRQLTASHAARGK